MSEAIFFALFCIRKKSCVMGQVEMWFSEEVEGISNSVL